MFFKFNPQMTDKEVKARRLHNHRLFACAGFWVCISFTIGFLSHFGSDGLQEVELEFFAAALFPMYIPVFAYFGETIERWIRAARGCEKED